MSRHLHGVLGALLFAMAAAAGGAQAPVGNATTDSASAARAAWRRANAALQSGDLASARSEVERAASAWPTQEAYIWGLAAMAARMRDTAGVVAGLDAYARLGLGRDARNEPALAAFASVPALQAAIARHDANRATIVRGAVRTTLPDSTFWPEGVDYDAKGGTYFVASIRHRTIAQVTPGDASARELLPRGASGVGAIFGVRVDSKHGVLWATTSGVSQMDGFVPGDSAIAALLKIRVRDGAIERRWNLPVVPGGHVLGDLAIGPRGDVFISDSREPVLYRLPPGAESLVPLRHPLFRSLQGIAPAIDGRTIYVADYSHGILRVDVATGAVARVADAPGSVSLGCDGIVWHRGAIVAVQNGVLPARIMRFTLSSDGARFTRAEVLDRNPVIADEPTIGTIAGNEFVYVANSQWKKRDNNGNPRAGAALRRPVLIAVPLTPR